MKSLLRHIVYTRVGEIRYGKITFQPYEIVEELPNNMVTYRLPGSCEVRTRSYNYFCHTYYEKKLK